jgi:phage shock protein PspC (stress-responsive transcriptional regulator)
MTTRITKSKTDRVIDGVCGGLAEYFGIDSLLVRLAFVALMFINGIGVILYIIFVIIMPKAKRSKSCICGNLETNDMSGFKKWTMLVK